MEHPLSGTALELNVAVAKRNEIVRAGAGAGKTYALTHKVMDLAEEYVREHKRFPRLIVTTFTRKATQELRERLMLLALEEKPELVDFVNSRAHLVVSTIHGIMDMYLKRYGANINVDPAYRVVGGPEASKLARQTLRQLLLDGDQSHGEPSDLLETFQFNTLVKLVRRIDGVLAENPDAKPFSVREFESVFRERSAQAVALFREVSARIREETTKDNWVEIATVCDTLAKLMSTGEWTKNRELFAMAREAMPIARRSAKAPVDETTIALAQEARALAGEFCETIYDPAAWEKFTARYAVIDELARRFSEEFRKAKIEQGWLEIGDLERLAMSGIRQHPHTVEAFQKEWDFWLVDEYQDTSPFQVDLLRNLSGGSPSFIVGDPQQSIYLFRGARSEVFGQREKQILESGGQQKLLSVNRRSRPELLLFLNDFFSRLTPPFQEMEPFLEGDAQVDASAVVARVFIGQPPAALEGDAAAEAPSKDDDSGREPATLDDSKTASEMRALVRHVQNLLGEGASPEEICILARTNRVLNEAATWLSRSRLPTHVHSAAGFYDRREIRDALALLKFLANPADGFNLVELLRSPWFRVPDYALVPLAKPLKRKNEQAESLWDRLVSERSMADEFRAVGRLQELLRVASRDGLSEAFRRGIIDAGFIDLAHAHDVSGRRESNIWKLLSRLQQEECRSGFNPLAFIARSMNELKLEEGNAEGDAVAAVEPNRINLMTVHASKGLEFKHVILPRMEQRARVTTNEDFTFDEVKGRWALRVPHGEDNKPSASLPESAWLESFQRVELEEHARVLYVALTRASESVFMSWTAPAQKNSWAEMVRLELSPGEHQAESYKYLVEVAGEGDSIEAPAPAPVVFSEPRGYWRKPVENASALGLGTASETPKELSVSDLLERKPGVHRTTATDRQLAQSLMNRSRGTAVHKLMELIKYRASGQLEQLISKWFPKQEDEVLGALNFVRASKAPPLLEIITNGEVEKGFVFIEGPLMIPGQIDLWGRTDAGVPWIIDYKTGSPEDRTDAFSQMGIYALALTKSGWIRPEERIQLAAVYPFARKIYTQEAPTREQVRFQLGLKD